MLTTTMAAVVVVVCRWVAMGKSGNAEPLALALEVLAVHFSELSSAGSGAVAAESPGTANVVRLLTPLFRDGGALHGVLDSAQLRIRELGMRFLCVIASASAVTVAEMPLRNQRLLHRAALFLTLSSFGPVVETRPLHRQCVLLFALLLVRFDSFVVDERFLTVSCSDDCRRRLWASCWRRSTIWSCRDG
jgi:hypothetical protein